MNEELASELVKEIGGGKTKFFECNVLETESISKAVQGSLAWAKETGKPVGGVVAAAGVSTPAKVSFVFFLSYVARSVVQKFMFSIAISHLVFAACDYEILSFVRVLQQSTSLLIV